MPGRSEASLLGAEYSDPNHSVNVVVIYHQVEEVKVPFYKGRHFPPQGFLRMDVIFKHRGGGKMAICEDPHRGCTYYIFYDAQHIEDRLVGVKRNLCCCVELRQVNTTLRNLQTGLAIFGQVAVAKNVNGKFVDLSISESVEAELLWLIQRVIIYKLAVDIQLPPTLPMDSRSERK